MKEFKNGIYVGERALFKTNDATINGCIFEDGESPLKESSNLNISQTVFRWKYPLWYCNHINVDNCFLIETARSGIWYTKDIKIKDTNILAPKTFRRCDGVILDNVELSNAQETLWNCKNIRMNKITAKGDYFGFGSENIEVFDFVLDGNYAFDGAKNIVIKNSRLNTKDAFWNCENVEVYNSTIIGEYLAWNCKNIKFINCTIESHQGLCYIKGLTMKNCKMINSDLCFEFCEDIDVEIVSSIDSVKNSISGHIKAKKINELILDKDIIDPSKTEIEIIK